MRDRRRELQDKLEGILGSDHVYFQPPETVKLVYPCIIYERLRVASVYADNKEYNGRVRYRLTYISYDPDLTLHRQFAEVLPYLSYDNTFGRDGLNHDVYTFYY